MRARHVVVSIVLALALTACGSGEDPTMPDVVGQTLDVALSDIERAGFSDDVDVVGGGIFGVVDESNWQVCGQLPEAGTAVADAPRLTVDRTCDDTQAPSESADESSAQPPKEEDSAPPGPGTDEPLTVETNADFASLLATTDYCSETISNFADQYAGRTIMFDGAIVAMNSHDNAKTRFDILINTGDFSETTARPGPQFQFRDVSATYDLHLTGASIPDMIGVGDNLRVTAQVDEFVPQQCLFLLNPVSTEIR